MGQVRRREAIGDAQIRTSGITERSFGLIQQGTRAHGPAYGGTVVFARGAFVGTPTVMLTPLGAAGYRLAGGGTLVPLTVISRTSAQFTYFGTPRHGTFGYLAIGSYSAPVT